MKHTFQDGQEDKEICMKRVKENRVGKESYSREGDIG